MPESGRSAYWDRPAKLGADTRRRCGQRLSGLIALGFLALAITLLLALL